VQTTAPALGRITREYAITKSKSMPSVGAKTRFCGRRSNRSGVANHVRLAIGIGASPRGDVADVACLDSTSDLRHGMSLAVVASVMTA
jgi:hypothetical protein